MPRQHNKVGSEGDSGNLKQEEKQWRKGCTVAFSKLHLHSSGTVFVGEVSTPGLRGYLQVTLRGL